MKHSRYSRLIASGLVLSGLGAFAAVPANYTAVDGDVLAVDKAETQVDVPTGVNMALAPSAQSVTLRVQSGATAQLGAPQYDDTTVTNAPWAGKVGLWLDGSDTNSFGYLNATLYKPDGVEGASAGTTARVLERWYDRRDANRTMEWRGYNNRGSGYASVMPYAVSAGDYRPNGRSYVSLGVAKEYARRMPFIKVVDGEEQAGSAGSAPSNAMSAQYVIMVFGSQNNGGQAIMSGMNRYSSADQVDPPLSRPIFNTRRETRLGGCNVDPTQENLLNGDWQIIAFQPIGTDSVKGLGWASFGKYYGGQNYAEVLVFTNMPDLVEIASAERYLAEKWGIEGYAPVSVDARVYGAGSIAVGQDVKLGGEFSGTLTVPAGSTVELVDTRLAPTNPAAIPVGTEDALWFDTSRRDLTTLNGGDSDLCDRLGTLKNLVKPGWYPLCGGGRGAGLVDAARGWGPTLCWYDYRQSLTGNGNLSRFKDTYSSTGYTYDAKTVFMVLDTSKGGGTPILDTDVTNPVYLSRRAKSSSPIYVPNAGYAFVTNSPCYLNGVSVKSGERGFNGRGEVLSTVFSETIPVKCIASYQEFNDIFEMRHGEVLFYKDALTDAQRRDTEAYLMRKWLGITPAGYGDPSAMTIAGSGTVKLANHAAAKPQFAAAFAGTVGAASGALSFTVTAGMEAAVADPLLLGDGSFDAGEALTVNMTLDGNVAPGRYLLIDAAAWAGTEPTLGTVVKTVSPKRTCTLVREGGKLYLNVEADGLTILVR